MIMLVLAFRLEVVLTMVMHHLQNLMPTGAVKGDILIIPNCKALLGVVQVLLRLGLIDLQVELLVCILLVLATLEAGAATIKGNAVDWLANKILWAHDTADPCKCPMVSKDSRLATFVMSVQHLFLGRRHRLRRAW